MNDFTATINNIPSVRELESHEQFYSRTNQIRLVGIADKSIQKDIVSDLVSKISDYIENYGDSRLYIVELGEVPKGKPSLASKQAYRQLNQIIAESWGETTTSSRLEYIGVLFSHYDKSIWKKLYFGLFIGSKSYSTNEYQVNRLDTHFFHKNSSFWDSQYSANNILASIIDMGFRTYLESNTDPFSGSVSEKILFKELIFIRLLDPKGYVNGYKVTLNINSHGILNVNTAFSRLFVDNQENKVILPITTSSTTSTKNEQIMALKAGHYKTLDARKQQSNFIKYPAVKGLESILSGKSNKGKASILGTKIIFLNSLYDHFLSYLDSAKVNYEPESFKPAHTIDAKLLVKKESEILKKCIQKKLTDGIEIALEPNIDTKDEDLIFGKLDEVIKTYFSLPDSSFLEKVDYHSSKSELPRLYINATTEDLDDSEASNSTIAATIEGKKKYFDSFFDVTKSNYPASSFDTYTQEKLKLWMGDKDSWHPIQGINLSTIQDDQTVNHALNKSLNELSMKAYLYDTSFTLKTEIPESLSGQYAGLYFRCPKQSGVRASLLIGTVDKTGWNNEYWDGVHLPKQSRYQYPNEWKLQVEAMIKLARKSNNRSLKELVIGLKQFTDDSFNSIFFNETFLLFDLNEKTVIKISHAYNFTPELIGAFDRGLVEKQVFTMKDNSPWLNRKSHDKHGKMMPPSKSLVPHFNLPSKVNVAFQVSKRFARSIYAIDTNQIVRKNNRLRDFSAYSLNTDAGDMEVMDNVTESRAFIFHHHTLVLDYIKDSAVAKTSLIEKLCKLIAIN